jgi:ADP-heptose:LPS heptosyltransferase
MRYPPRKILAIDCSPFFRSLATLPALAALRVAHPQAVIVAAMSRGACELLNASGHINEAVDLGVSGRLTPGAVGAAKRAFKLVTATRNRSFDLVLDFSPRFETQLVARFGLGGRVVTPAIPSRLFDSVLGRKGKVLDHAVECVSVLRQVKVDIDPEPAGIRLPAEENARFEQLLGRHRSRGGEPIVLIHGCNSEQMPDNSWPGELAARLARGQHARVIAVDEPYSRDFTDRVGRSLPPNAIKLVAPRAMEVAAAVARASLVITDQPEMWHMARQLKTPMLELSFGQARQSDVGRVVISMASPAALDDAYDAGCEMLHQTRSPFLFG